jgi:acyl carrier protein
MLEYEPFARRVVDMLELAASELPNAEASVYEELGLDSLQAFQLIIVIESLADVTPIDDLPAIYTMRDAYNYYADLCRHDP